MPLISLADVQAIAQGDPFISALRESDPVVKLVFEFVDLIVEESTFLSKTKLAQTYYAAHLFALAGTEAGGKGPVSSETIGGITQSFTLPYLNRHTVIASTQYGLMYLELRDHVVVPFGVAIPS